MLISSLLLDLWFVTPVANYALAPKPGDLLGFIIEIANRAKKTTARVLLVGLGGWWRAYARLLCACEAVRRSFSALAKRRTRQHLAILIEYPAVELHSLLAGEYERKPLALIPISRAFRFPYCWLN